MLVDNHSHCVRQTLFPQIETYIEDLSPAAVRMTHHLAPHRQ